MGRDEMEMMGKRGRIVGPLCTFAEPMLATPEPDSSGDDDFFSPKLNLEKLPQKQDLYIIRYEAWGNLGHGESSVWGDFQEMGLGHESFAQETPRASGASTLRNLFHCNNWLLWG